MIILIRFAQNKNANRCTVYILDISETVGHLKSRICHEYQSKFRTFYFNKKKLDDNRTLQSYGIDNDSTLELKIQDEIVINLQDQMTSEKKTLRVETNTSPTFKSVIKKLKKEHHLKGNFTIIGIHSWEEADSIWSHKIENGSIINYSVSWSPEPKNADEKKIVEIWPSKNKGKPKEEEEEEEKKEPQRKNGKKWPLVKRARFDERKMKNFIESAKNKLKPLIPQEKIQEFENILRKCSQEKVTILVTGFTSSGKTTFINQLISYFRNNGQGKQEEFLPSQFIENTAFFWVISKNTQDDKIILKVMREKDEFKFSQDDQAGFLSKINELDKNISRLDGKKRKTLKGILLR